MGIPNDVLYLKVEEAAKILRISRNAAYRAAADGTLPGVVRIGPKTLRVLRSALLVENGNG